MKKVLISNVLVFFISWPFIILSNCLYLPIFLILGQHGPVVECMITDPKDLGLNPVCAEIGLHVCHNP